MKQKNPDHVKQLITANPEFKKPTPDHDDYLNVAELFQDTIQGENFVGWPSTFMRLQYCTLNCIFCDTQSVWKYGNPYTFEEIFEMFDKGDTIRKFKEGQHLILTGGSPLKQQNKLIKFFDQFRERYGFIPYIEIENETVLFPDPNMIKLVKCWNNSPKLKNSGNPDILRYRPDVLKFTSQLHNSWFKFVIDGSSMEAANRDWEEIKSDFLDRKLINKDQIVLMPMGGSREELHANRHIVVELAIRENVRYTSREHVELWDILTGV